MSTTKRRIEYELGISIDNTGLTLLKDELAQLRLNIKGSKEMKDLTKELQTAYGTRDNLPWEMYRKSAGQLFQILASCLFYQNNICILQSSQNQKE